MMSALHAQYVMDPSRAIDDSLNPLCNAAVRQLVMKSMMNHVAATGDGSATYMLLITQILNSLIQSAYCGNRDSNDNFRVRRSLQRVIDEILPQHILPILVEMSTVIDSDCSSLSDSNLYLFRQCAHTLLSSNCTNVVADHLSSLIADYFSNFKPFGDNNRGNNVRKNLLFIQEHFDRLAVAIGRSGSVQDSQCVEGLFFEQDRSNRFMPMEISGRFRVLLLEDLHSKYDEDKADDNIQLQLSAEQIQSIDQQSSKSVNAFAMDLKTMDIHLILVSGAEMNEEMALVLSQHKILAVGGLGVEETQLICKLLEVEPMLFPGIAKGDMPTSNPNLRSVSVGQHCFMATHVQILLSNKNRAFVHIVPLRKGIYTMLLRASTIEIAKQNKEFTRRVVNNVLFATQRAVHDERDLQIRILPGGGTVFVHVYQILNQLQTLHDVM